jgi:hypothetical protein
MTMPSMYGGYGATEFPVAVPTTTQFLDGLDLQQTCLALLLRDAINAECGTTWRRICHKLEEGHYLNRVMGQNPVAEVVDLEPSPAVLGQRFSHWPILAVYRDPGAHPETKVWNIEWATFTRQPWAVDWVIGPLDAGDQARVGKFALVVADVIRAVCEEGWHPAHLSGTSVFYGIFDQVNCVGQLGPGVAQVLGNEDGAGYYGISLLLSCTGGRVKTVGHSTDVRNKYYAAYRNAPAGTPITDIFTDGRIENQSEDP